MATVSEGVVFAWSCTACRDRLGITGGTEYAPGRWNLGPMHIGHVPELVALGWQSRCTPASRPTLSASTTGSSAWRARNGTLASDLSLRQAVQAPPRRADRHASARHPVPRCRWPMFKSADQAAAHGAPRWLSELDVDHVQWVAFGGAGGDSVLAHARCNRAGGQAITAAILRRRADR